MSKIYPKKSLQGKICLSPFLSIEVDIRGSVRLCGCADWMPSMVGNLFEQSLVDILSNSQSQAIRQSIINGTYEYCNENTCGIIKNNSLNSIDNVPPTVTPLLADAEKFIMPTEIVVAGDVTCNLSCPSCRPTVLKNNELDVDRNRELGSILRSNLFSIPSQNKIKLTVSTTGELFASPLLMSFVNSINVEDFPNLELGIQTNGLLVEQNWHKLGAMQDRVSLMCVTVDAARGNTYEQLRRGGKWSDIQKALQWIANKKRKNNMQFTLRMVVQHANYSEMLEFYNLAMELGVDRVEYARINYWGSMPRAEFQQTDVFNSEHSEYKQAQQAFDQVKDLPNVFFYGGIQ